MLKTKYRMTWSSLTELNQFLLSLHDYSVDLNTCFNVINSIKEDSTNTIENIILHNNFSNIFSFNIKYTFEAFDFKLYTTIINVKYNNLIKLKFKKHTKKIQLLNIKGVLFHMGMIIDEEKKENSSLIILELVMNSIIDKLISYDNKNILVKDIYRKLKRNIIKKNYLRYYCIDLELIKSILTYSLSLKETKIIKPKKIYEKETRVIAKVPYLGDSEDTIPYLLQFPNMLFSLTDIDFSGLNIPIYSTRKGVHFCVLGWLTNYLKDFNIFIDQSTNELFLFVYNNTISVNSIVDILDSIIKNTKKLYSRSIEIIEYNILDLIEIDYTYATCLKLGTSSNICINFSSLWYYFDTCTKSEQNNLLRVINCTINNYNRSKIVSIILFDDVIELTDKIGSVIKYTLERIDKRNIEIVLFNNTYSSEKEAFASEFLYKFCKPCSSFKNSKYLTHTFHIGSHEITKIHLGNIKDFDTKLDSILELKTKFHEFICVKLFDDLSRLKKNKMLRSCKYFPCMKCKTIDTCKILYRETRQLIKCRTCKSKLCLTCFNYHEGEHCSQTSIKQLLLKMVGDNTLWYCGSSLITGLSSDALNDMMVKTFDKCNPDCFCEKCLSHHTLTYLESDRLACNHVTCPNCGWSGCFMCGKAISPHNYTETHLISVAYKEFMNELCLLVKEEYIPNDKTEWRCYVSVCSIFIDDKFRLVDILWILLNLSTIPDYVTNKWSYVRKFILSMLFAPNTNNSDLKAIRFIETCRKATTFQEFYSIVIDIPDVYKTFVPIEWCSSPIRDGLYSIWENLFLKSLQGQYRAWANMCDKGNWHINVIKRFIRNKCH